MSGDTYEEVFQDGVEKTQKGRQSRVRRSTRSGSLISVNSTSVTPLLFFFTARGRRSHVDTEGTRPYP